MMTLPRLFAAGLFLMLSASAQQAVTVTKCQKCSNDAAKTLQACQSTGNAARVAACQKDYQKKMTHCNKKWCSPQTTKVKVTPAH